MGGIQPLQALASPNVDHGKTAGHVVEGDAREIGIAEALLGQPLADHIGEQGDAAHGGAGGHTQALVGVV